MTEKQALMMVTLAKRLITDAYHDMDHDDFIESFKLYTQVIKELFEAEAKAEVTSGLEIKEPMNK
jgi:triphosphoribosyl-dephospho-CoA synthetase